MYIQLVGLILDVITLIFLNVYHEDSITASGANKPVDVDTWLFVGAISDIMICLIFICAPFVFSKIYHKKYDNFKDLRTLNTRRSRATGHLDLEAIYGTECGLEFPFIIFMSIWTVFGLILFSVMDKGHPCSILVLCWCILQIIFGVMVPCILRLIPAAWEFLTDLGGVAFICYFTLLLPICNWCDEDAVGRLVLTLGFCAFLLKLGSLSMDIVMLSISTESCNGADAAAFHLGPLDLNSWIFVGAITDILIVTTFCTRICENNGKFCGNPYGICLMTLVISFSLLWSVFGFLLWTDMNAESVDEMCPDMVLSWSIYQILSGVLCCGCLSVINVKDIIDKALDWDNS